MKILRCIFFIMALFLLAAKSFGVEGPLNTSKTVIILLGPPGSGKGTQAEKLSKELMIPHISTGDLFRENLRNKTPLGEKVRSFMDQGKLVPDELVLEMLFDRVTLKDAENGYLLDGFPRTIPQAEALDKKLAGTDQLVVLNLQVEDKVIVDRMSGRLICSVCSKTYHTVTAPPKESGVCDACQGTLCQRNDDKSEVVLERLKIYHDQTEPLITFYENKHVLHSVDGCLSPQAVFGQLLSFVELAKKS